MRTLDSLLPWAVRASKGVVSGTGSSMAARAVDLTGECLGMEAARISRHALELLGVRRLDDL